MTRFSAAIGVIVLSLLPARAQLRPWRDYQVIMWVGDSAYKQPAKIPLFFQRLREMGVNTAMVFDDGDRQPLAGKSFSVLRREHRQSRPLPEIQFQRARLGQVRHPMGGVRPAGNRPLCAITASTIPPGAIGRASKCNKSSAKTWPTIPSPTTSATNCPRRTPPIRSTTISVRLALAAFREWLRTQYHDLAALNAEWETQFKSWDEVKPFSTDQIKNRMASGDALPRGKPDWQAVEALKFDPVAARQSPRAGTSLRGRIFGRTRTFRWRRALADLRDAAHERRSRARPWASKARKWRTLSAVTISGGWRRRSIGSSRTTSAMRAKSSARSCRASRCSPPFSSPTQPTRAAGSGTFCWKATAAASFGGAKIALIGKARITR